MGIRFGCPDCHRQLNVKDALGGKRGRCPHCQTTFRIPKSDQPWADPIEESGTHGAPGAAVAKSSPAVESPPADALQANPGATWYVRPQSGGQFGPADGATIRKWIDEGRIAADTWVWREGWAQWRLAAETLGDVGEAANAPLARLEASVAVEAAAALSGGDNESAPAFLERHEPLGALDPRLASKRRRSHKRTILALLALLSLALLAALIIVLMTGWTLFDRESPIPPR